MDRIPVSTPLTPQRLVEINAWKTLPTLDDWDSEPPYERIYTAYLQHGYVNQERIGGMLWYKRHATDSQGHFKLEVVESRFGIANNEHTLKADMILQEDTLSRPISWELSSEFSVKGEIIDERLRYLESGQLKGDQLKINTKGVIMQRKVGKSLATNWGLFDALARMQGKLQAPIELDLLQDLSLYKPDQTLRLRKKRHQSWFENQDLHCFSLLGAGNLPWEYWLDDQGRVLCAINSFNIWLLDAEAPQRFAAFKEQISRR